MGGPRRLQVATNNPSETCWIDTEGIEALSKRRRFSRWRRLPGVYRFGDDKPTDPHQEPQRLTLYVAGTVLDRAEMQAIRHGLRDAQEYCTEILLRAIDAEHVREQMADVE